MPEPKQLSWDEIDGLVGKVVQQIQKGEWRPDVIVGMSRGGFIPATMIALKLGVTRLAGLDAVKGLDGKRSLGHLVALNDLSTHRVLVVEDAIITGRLLRQGFEAARAQGGDVRTCALVSGSSDAGPDYFAKKVDEIPIFPWEPSNATH